ncbi:MAG: GNAT family N-acetyltransferase, partial [Bacteroidota bacterium]
MSITIRNVKKADLADLKEVLNSIDLFPAEMLEEMIADYFDNTSTQAIWFTAVEAEKAIAIAYCAPEQLTEGTYNLYAIGVRSDHQGKGIGRQMMHYLEQELQQSGHRILIVETSGTEDFKLTRQFYEKLNYT